MAEQDTSFGPNAWLVDEMYDQYRADPSSVSESWRDFFADERDGEQPAKEPVQTATETATEEKPTPKKTEKKPEKREKKPEKAEKAEKTEGKTESKQEADQGEPIQGAAARIVQNMEASLAVPTATSVRTVPARL